MCSSDFFETYTLAKLESCQINAAWLRHLQDIDVYKRNPYTDIDLLVCRLLGRDHNYSWIKINAVFDYSNSKIQVTMVNSDLCITNHTNRPVIFNKDAITFFDHDNNVIGGSNRFVILENGTYIIKIINPASYIRFSNALENIFMSI